VERAGSGADYKARRFPRAKAALGLDGRGVEPPNHRNESQPQAVSKCLRPDPIMERAILADSGQKRGPGRSRLCGNDRSLMAGGRVKGTARTRHPFLVAAYRSAGSAATIDARRAETQSGSAAPPGAGERDPTSGRVPPHPLAARDRR
jgi:hypothetical protein